VNHSYSLQTSWLWALNAALVGAFALVEKYVLVAKNGWVEKYMSVGEYV
jgi:hypothetical protein